MLRWLIISQAGVVGSQWNVVKFLRAALTRLCFAPNTTPPLSIHNLLSSRRIKNANLPAQVFSSHRSTCCVILIVSRRTAYRRHAGGEASAGFSLVKFVLAFSARERLQAAYGK